MIRKILICAVLMMVISLCACAQRLQISTNAMDLMCLGTLNGEVNYAVSQHWSVGVSGKFNPFTYNKGSEGREFQLRQRSVAAGARWWPWHVYSGWWLSAGARLQEYNMGGILSPETEEGIRYGGGVTAGYSHMVSTHLNVEFGLGVWGGMKSYTIYSCPKCGTRIDNGIKSFIMPSDLIVALSYVF